MIENTQPEIVRQAPEASFQRHLLQVGGATAWVQFAWLLLIVVAGVLLGTWPETVEGYFSMYAETPLLGLLRDDFTSLVLILLYIGLMPGIVIALWQEKPTLIFFITLLTLVVIISATATQSSFGLLYLAERYEVASTTAERTQLLAAGEAVLATNMWNSTAGFVSGIFLQGSGVVLSWVMLRSKKFGTLTGSAGIIANGFDLLQHVLHLFAPAAASVIIIFAGPFYLLWYPLMGRDLLRLTRSYNQD